MSEPRIYRIEGIAANGEPFSVNIEGGATLKDTSGFLAYWSRNQWTGEDTTIDRTEP